MNVDVDVACAIKDDDPFRRHSVVCGFVARDAGHDVGRLVACRDRRHDDGHATFGHIQLARGDDAAALVALLAAAEEWARAQGAPSLVGPQDGHVLSGYRAQISGFERPAFLLEPRNTPFLPQTLASLGYAACAVWRTWDIHGLRLRAWQLLHRVQARRNEQHRRAGYALRSLDLGRFDDELKAIHRLVGVCYRDNWGMVPTDLDEYAHIHAPLRHLPGLGGVFLTHNGADVGFGIGQIAGRTTVLHSFGIDPAHRGRGLAHMIYQAAFDHIAGGDTDNVIGALAKEGSTKYSWLGAPSRRYAMFEKSLSPTRSP